MSRRQAIETGADRYHGKPCKKCGSTLRTTNNGNCAYTHRVLHDGSHTYREIEQLSFYYAKKKLREGLSERSCLRVSARYRQHEARAMGLGGYVELSVQEELDLFAKYVACERKKQETGQDFVIDHIVPLFQGGKHHPDNIQVLPLREHWKKTGREIRERYWF